MAKEKILVAVKTYPTLSRKYGETVCTAGLREDGSWVRLYPVPFRRLEEEQQYSKFDWIELDIVNNKKDVRPESHHPVDLNKITKVGHIGTTNNWQERRRLILQTAKNYDRLSPLIAGAKANKLSLAVFKPTKIVKFIWKAEEERQWDPAKLAEMRSKAQQKELFSEESWRETFQILPKLPYAFSYQFEDTDGKLSTMQILDWEIGALYWNCLKSSNNNEAKALGKVKAKYFDEFIKKDLHFFLGTTQQFHSFAPNPWVIIGVFSIPDEKQLPLL